MCIRSEPLGCGARSAAGRRTRGGFARTRIVAPTAETPIGRALFTLGAVVALCSGLMSIVSNGDPLVVNAHVALADIDPVPMGLLARVRLTAFSLLYTAPLDGA